MRSGRRLGPLIPAAKPGGRPRKTDMRAAMNAIFYLLRTGCPWRYLPPGLFPPRSTVYNIFRQFQRDGVWERIWEELHMALREALDREASPTAAILDSQSLKVAMARPRQDPPALSMAGTYLGRRRLQRPSGQGCRGQIRRGSGSKSSSAPTTSKAPEMGRRANLLMVWPQPPSRQRLPEPRRNSSRVRNPRRNPIRHQTLGPQVAF